MSPTTSNPFFLFNPFTFLLPTPSPPLFQFISLLYFFNQLIINCLKLPSMDNYTSKPKSNTVKNSFTQSNPPTFKLTKTTSMSSSTKRLTSMNSNPPLCQSTKLDKVVVNFSNRASGRINFNSPTHEVRCTQTQAELMENVVKQNLKSLSYREKLLNIEALIKNSRELCQQFGYFYITCAMLFYDPFSEIKLSVWVHPDTRITKCLHPIKKKTQQESQTQFINNFKIVLKQFFPTVYIGSAKSFVGMLAHVEDLKTKLFSKNKKSKIQYSGMTSINLEKTEKKICLRYTSNCKETKKCLKLDIPFQEEKNNGGDRGKRLKASMNGQCFYSDKNISVSKSRLDDFDKLFENEQQEWEGSRLNNTKIEQELNTLFESRDFGEGLYGEVEGGSKCTLEKMANQFNQIL